MKKFISILMALAIILSLSITAFAANNDGKITITNATVDQTYKLYRLFDASYKDDAVSYRITKESQFYSVLFNADGTPVSGNTFFTYNTDTHEVKKVQGVNDADLIAYIKGIIQGGTFETEGDPVKATSQTVTFDNIPYGYYIIDIADAGGAITVTSNTPEVEVIDKNQIPLTGGIEKKIWDADANDGAGAWADENTAFVGDIVKYRVTFTATNYAGMEQIRYYTLHDTKGNALWVEFGDDDIDTYDIVVKVGATTLTKGYYHLANQSIKTDVQEWEFLGTWTDEEKAAQKANGNVAQWYLIHYGYDEFEIVIPWLNGYKFTGSDNGFSLTYPENATSKYPSPSNVEVTYYASVEPNANIGKTDNLFNSAYVKWTSANSSKTSETDTVYTHVEGFGIHKMDAADHAALEGAEFELFLDKDCTQPLYVIPTGVEGVYVYDDLKSVGQAITGQNKTTAREDFEDYLDAYLNGKEQNNVVVSPRNGKIVVTGLKSGTYYVKETTPPSGYNSLTGVIEITAGNTDNRFYIYASEQGVVEDIQAPTPVYLEKEFIVEVADVYNSQGVELPSTGGEGTFWMITIGTLLAIGFAVFLITHKKMSVYTD